MDKKYYGQNFVIVSYTATNDISSLSCLLLQSQYNYHSQTTCTTNDVQMLQYPNVIEYCEKPFREKLSTTTMFIIITVTGNQTETEDLNSCTESGWRDGLGVCVAMDSMHACKQTSVIGSFHLCLK